MANYNKSIQMKKNIINATIKEVLKNGYKKTSIKDISESIGAPRTLIYYYFKNKEDIMHEIYDEKFFDIDSVTCDLLAGVENPLVKIMTKYIVYYREIATNPLFTEFLISYPEYSSVGSEEARRKTEFYYSDTYDAFKFYGKETDTEEYKVYILLVESISRALIRANYLGTIKISEQNLVKYLGERTIMLNFNLSKEDFMDILDQAFSLAYKFSLKDKQAE